MSNTRTEVPAVQPERAVDDAPLTAMAHRNRVPRVSVIMPFLDTPEAFLTEAVASVLGQTFTDWELLLVNDGSGSDATRVAAALAGRDPARIRCLQHPDGGNHGIPASRNVGLEQARGEFIAYLDSDDVWLPAKLQEQVTLLQAHPEVDLLFGRSLYWQSWDGQGGSDRDQLAPLGMPDRSVLEQGEFIHLMLTSRVIVPCPSNILVRATAARAVGGFAASVSNYYEDQGFYAKMSFAGRVLACDEVWDRYRLHSGSLLGGASRRQLGTARIQYLDWLLSYMDTHGIENPALRRDIRIERAFAGVPAGPRMLRYLRRLARLPQRRRGRRSRTVA
jgi:glycosyltransferase involved in cell wall biosynthesis